MNNKLWKKPTLTVLSRSRTEEVVLKNCKSAGGTGAQNSSAGGCNKINCSICQQYLNS